MTSSHVKFFGKLIVPIIVAVVVLFVFIFPVATLTEAQSPLSTRAQRSAAALLLDGEDIPISPENKRGASPVIDVGNNGVFIAVGYHKQGAANGGVHIKSATEAEGWLTTRYLGTGENPRLVFGQGSNNRVFAVWEKDGGQAIGFANCRLSLLNRPSCAISEVTEAPDVETPDIAVDSSGALHVAWVQAGDIRTARSTNNGQNWDIMPAKSNLQSGGANDFETPRLAAGDGALHLVFRRKALADNLGKAIRYYQADLDNHAESGLKNFTIGAEVSAGYRDLANPTIAADGMNVYLAWDAQQIGAGARLDDFGLMRVTSADGGDTWSTAKHITDDSNASGGVGGGAQDPPKISRQPEDAVPIQEGTLRPSLTLSGSGYALVWHERAVGGGGCSERGNASSEIHLAYTDTQWLTDMAADDSTQYSIDPDLAVDGAGTRHLVFMKDDEATSCLGGDAIDYRINYRGPFTKTTRDGGEDLTDPDNSGIDPNAPKTQLPIIFKG